MRDISPRVKTAPLAEWLGVSPLDSKRLDRQLIEAQRERVYDVVCLRYGLVERF